MARAKARTAVASPLRVGTKVFIRTVTQYYTGLIEILTKDEIVLSSGAWVACTRRWSDTLATGVLDEVEPYQGDGIVSIARGAVVDVAEWCHALPRTQR